jgi:hypothetical protein
VRAGVDALIIRYRLIIARHVTGVVLACSTIDYRVLFEPLTEEIVQDGFQYYRTFYNAPPGIKVRSIFIIIFMGRLAGIVLMLHACC